MRKDLRVLSIVFAGLFSIFMNGCNQRMDTVIDMVTDSPPTTEIEPVTPPMQPAPDQSYTFHRSLDHQSPIDAIAFSPDGQTLASLGGDSLKLWDPHTEQLKETTPVEGAGDIRWVFYDQDGHMWLGGPDYLSDYVTGHTSPVRAFGLMLNLEMSATGSSDKTVRVWDTLAEAHKFTLEHEGQVWAVVFSPDGQTLATGGSFEGIYLWDAGTGQSKGAPLIANTGQVEGLAFSSDGHTLFVATGRGDGEAIHVWDLNTNTHIDTLMAEGYTIRKVAVSPDGQLIAGGAYYSEEGPGIVLWKRK